MNTITLEDGTLCLDGEVLNGAREAFDKTRYVEAFALLHAYIDWWMTDLIQLDECVRDSSKTRELATSQYVEKCRNREEEGCYELRSGIL